MVEAALLWNLCVEGPLHDTHGRDALPVEAPARRNPGEQEQLTPAPLAASLAAQDAQEDLPGSGWCSSCSQSLHDMSARRRSVNRPAGQSVQPPTPVHALPSGQGSHALLPRRAVWPTAQDVHDSAPPRLYVSGPQLWQTVPFATEQVPAAQGSHTLVAALAYIPGLHARHSERPAS